MANARVVIASPSLIDKSRLEKVLAAAGGFDIVAHAADLSATYLRVEELMPDFVIIAEGMTHVAEYQCMDSLFRAVETRVVKLHPSPGAQGQAAWAAQYKDCIHPLMQPAEVLRVLQNAVQQKMVSAAPRAAVANLHTKPSVFQQGKMILIGASTGGIDALTTILQHFPADCPPTAIVQHTGQSFSETLVRLFDRNCAAQVVAGETGLDMQRGRICLAGGLDGHLVLEQRGPTLCRVMRGPPTSGHMPSIDELFLSARPFAGQVVAALLTGMGRDGASGLLALRQSGAVTIGQDQATSVVYGMPRVAHEIGAVQYQMALPNIGPALLNFCTADAAQNRRIG
jgi:two-component system, chemotaxis family, protein-glutamate methylesterase/glutaminase